MSQALGVLSTTLRHEVTKENTPYRHLKNACELYLMLLGRYVNRSATLNFNQVEVLTSDIIDRHNAGGEFTPMETIVLATYINTCKSQASE